MKKRCCVPYTIPDRWRRADATGERKISETGAPVPRSASHHMENMRPRRQHLSSLFARFLAGNPARLCQFWTGRVRPNGTISRIEIARTRGTVNFAPPPCPARAGLSGREKTPRPSRARPSLRGAHPPGGDELRIRHSRDGSPVEVKTAPSWGGLGERSRVQESVHRAAVPRHRGRARTPPGRRAARKRISALVVERCMQQRDRGAAHAPEIPVRQARLEALLHRSAIGDDTQCRRRGCQPQRQREAPPPCSRAAVPQPRGRANSTRPVPRRSPQVPQTNAGAAPAPQLHPAPGPRLKQPQAVHRRRNPPCP